MRTNGELTAPTLPVAEIAATVRPDCRNAFLNIVRIAQELQDEKLKGVRNNQRVRMRSAMTGEGGMELCCSWTEEVQVEREPSEKGRILGYDWLRLLRRPRQFSSARHSLQLQTSYLNNAYPT